MSGRLSSRPQPPYVQQPAAEADWSDQSHSDDLSNHPEPPTIHPQIAPDDNHSDMRQPPSRHEPALLASSGSEYDNTLYHQDSTNSLVLPRYTYSDSCAKFPDTSGITFVLKTGETELFEKLPTHIITSLQCLPDTIIFSDMEQQVGPWHIYDALKDVDDLIKQEAPEFALYKSLHSCPVSQRECIRAHGSEGWRLDKYKFMHIIERTWHMQPYRDWYVFAEADTYLVWSNLVTFLRKYVDQDPAARLYIGSVTLVNDYPFAHGGSGYVLSGAVLRDLIENNAGLASDYDLRAGEQIYGDLVLAYAIKERSHVAVRQAHPMFNGEKATSLPFGHGHWCEPVISLHHLDPGEIGALWQFEQTRVDKDKPLMFKDLYFAFVARHIANFRSDWDNLSDDVCYVSPDPEVISRSDPKILGRQKPADALNAVERQAHNSEHDCSRVCEFEGIDVDRELDILKERHPAPSESEETLDEQLQRVLRDKRDDLDKDYNLMGNRQCFQWRYNDNTCCVSHRFKLGRPRMDSDESDTWHSGWYVKGIEEWILVAGGCDQPEWRMV